MMKYLNLEFVLLLLIFKSCNENSLLKDKLITKENEIWIVDDFSEVGHFYGFKFDENKYSYYIILESEKVFRRFDSQAEGTFSIRNDSVINYYFNGKITFLNQDSCVIRLKNNKTETLMKRKFINYKEDK